MVGPAALEDSDFTARVDLEGLPAGQRIFYRALFQDLTDLRTWSAPVAGSFATPAASARDVSFVWGGDVVGQGWGINPEWGGLRIFETMRRDGRTSSSTAATRSTRTTRSSPEVKLDDGTLWSNLVTPAKAKVAETLDEFRGNFLYNLLDDNVRRFNAEVPIVAQWDDHEVRNNWYPTQVLDDPRYKVKSVALLAARAKRAFLEYMPIRVPAFGPRAGLPQDRLRPRPRRLRPRHAFLSRAELRQPADRVGRRRGLPGGGPARLAPGRACRLARDLEGDRE